MSTTRTTKRVGTAITHEQAVAAARSFSSYNNQIARYKMSMTNATNAAKAKLDAAMLKIKEKWEPSIKDMEDAKKADFEILQKYAEQNHDSWDGKSQDLMFATIGFRTGQRSVEVKDAANIVDRMKLAGLKRYLRIKEEVNKVAILGEKNEIMLSTFLECGIEIKQEDSFYVEVKE